MCVTVSTLDPEERRHDEAEKFKLGECWKLGKYLMNEFLLEAERKVEFESHA